MFDRFTDNSKKVMSLARLAAIELQHDAIGSEHMLLAVLGLDHCTAGRILRALGVDGAALRASFVGTRRRGASRAALSQLPFEPEAKRVLEYCMEEAGHLGHVHIGSEHLLLALLRAEGPSAEALRAAGATLDRARAVLLEGFADPFDRDLAQRQLLLISNSTMHGGGYLAHCKDEIRAFLGDQQRVAFVPYALADHDGYEAKAIAAFGAIGHELVSVHRCPDPCRALDSAGAVFVGGGNTFRLLVALYRSGLLQAIRARVAAGMRYIGSSAGTNVATPSIKTTNDMPIMTPPSFSALALVPFQINPHYLDPEPGSTHMGETREQRLQQFHEENDTPVLGLREGCMLRVLGERMELLGTTSARLFRHGEVPVEFAPPCDLSFLLRARYPG